MQFQWSGGANGLRRVRTALQQRLTLGWLKKFQGQAVAWRQQMLILGVSFITVLLLIVSLVLLDNHHTRQTGQWLSDSVELQMLSQRLAKAAQRSLLGSAEAYKKTATSPCVGQACPPETKSEAHRQITASRDAFRDTIQRLQRGNKEQNLVTRLAFGADHPALDQLEAVWQNTDKNATLLIDEEQTMQSLGTALAQINSGNPQLLALTERVLALILDSSAGPREITAAGQLVMLTQRFSKNANVLLAGDIADAEVPTLIKRDVNDFAMMLSLLRGAGLQPRRGATDIDELNTRLQELNQNFQTYQDATFSILSNVERLIAARGASQQIVADSEGLLLATQALSVSYQKALNERATVYLTLVFSILGLLILVRMVWIYLHVERSARVRAELREHEEQARNARQQSAILGLLDEVQSFASGDLTVRADVNEESTGALADALNFAIEELRALITRVSAVVNEVGRATNVAQQAADSLLASSEEQSKDIDATSAEVLAVAQAIQGVSGQAAESATVARSALVASNKGHAAVQEAISGMHGIREHIQETAKRIKRLGDSSLQIGEIVELISDITEQTNVLALNAAIQAASAGEAGRGFTVVAEEVQRLAERSADASRQIAGLVKAIQADTQDAIAAMERSTLGVVEGTHRSDHAGQALTEIGLVSQRLAELIQQMATTSEQQSAVASQVATRMQGILKTNEKNANSTRGAADAMSSLGALAAELKQAITNFKL